MPDDQSRPDLILLVDDSPDELAMLAETMVVAGFEAVTAPHGADALRIAREVTPRLILLDAVMPGIDGFEACRRLKEDPRVAHVPVIFMTGLTDTIHVVEGLQAGAVDYVTKPVIMEELVARIRVHLANARVAEGARIGLDATGRHLLALDPAGRILWATPEAARSFRLLFPIGDPGDQLKALVAAGRRRITGAGGQALIAEFLCANGAREFLYRLSPADAHSEESRLAGEFGLTDREGEVLAWTARGKTNREISEILAISPRTVNKHLERVFTKLGVENRAAATSVAMRLLLARD
jgi:DNA-binding NarL/FixJ family response regulator